MTQLHELLDAPKSQSALGDLQRIAMGLCMLGVCVVRQASPLNSISAQCSGCVVNGQCAMASTQVFEESFTCIVHTKQGIFLGHDAHKKSWQMFLTLGMHAQ